MLDGAAPPVSGVSIAGAGTGVGKSEGAPSAPTATMAGSALMRPQTSTPPADSFTLEVRIVRVPSPLIVTSETSEMFERSA